MKLFNKKINRKLSVEEATDKLYVAISDLTGWKLVKSQKCIKKVINDLVFEIRFSSSKYNSSYENIRIYAEFTLICNKFNKPGDKVGFYELTPNKYSWWDITDEANLSNTIKKLSNLIKEKVIPLSIAFEKDFSGAVKMMTSKNYFNTYNIRLEFLDVYAGRENIISIAKEYYRSLPKSTKQDIVRYKQGTGDRAWMINPSNLKYIIDNNIIEI